MITFDKKSAHKVATLLERDIENAHEAFYFSDGTQTHKVTKVKPIYEDFECDGMLQSVRTGMFMSLSNAATLQVSFNRKNIFLTESCGKVTHLN